MLHEADFSSPPGGEGLGVTTVEHRVPRSIDLSQQGLYENCLYACRLCNRARSNRPIEQSEIQLLDPTVDVWKEHFTTTGQDRVEPRPGDQNALYTAQAYEPNDERKVERRRIRRHTITERLRMLDGLSEELELLFDAADRAIENRHADQLIRILHLMRTLRRARWQTRDDLERFSAIPADAPDSCRCKSTEHHSLPDWLERQTLPIPTAEELVR